MDSKTITLSREQREYLQSDLRQFQRLLDRLTLQFRPLLEEPATEPASKPSFAPMPGPALRLFEWLLANRPSTQGQLVLTAQIWGSSKSTSFTEPELAEMLPYFSTLLSTSPLPTLSTPSKVGGHGRVDPK